MPRIVLDTSTGYPRYDGDDPLLLEGAGRLLKAPDGSLRPEVDGGAWRAEPLGSGFRLIDRDGLYYDLGTQPATRIADPVDPSHVYAWQLETISDALGNTVEFTWLADGAQRYLQTVAYGQYALEVLLRGRGPTSFAPAGPASRCRPDCAAPRSSSSWLAPRSRCCAAGRSAIRRIRPTA